MRFLVMGAVVLTAACNGSGNPNVPPGDLVVWFDVQGVSNATCTLVAQSTSTSASFAIAAPSPAVQNTTLPPSPSAAKTCELDSSAIVPVTGPVTATASRTATEMCFKSSDLRSTLGFTDQDSPCSVMLTLTCEGVVIYDKAPWTICP